MKKYLNMSVDKLIIAVPARLDSLRLPRKVLIDIDGEPMLKRVLDQCKLVMESSAVVLCTDSKELKKLAEDWGFKVLMTSEKCTSGTDRISSVVNDLLSIGWGVKYSKNYIINHHVLRKTVILNVQADQPFVSPKLMSNIYNEFKKNNLNHDILTPIYLLRDKNIQDPNLVKVVVASNGDALYFSRSAIPYIRDKPTSEWSRYSKYYGHIGIYGFRANVLAQWREMPSSPLEKIESLEQLRFLEGGFRIKTLLANEEVSSIDTYDDLREVISKISLSNDGKTILNN